LLFIRIGIKVQNADGDFGLQRIRRAAVAGAGSRPAMADTGGVRSVGRTADSLQQEYKLSRCIFAVSPFFLL
jgi:hypothetical protein